MAEITTRFTFDVNRNRGILCHMSNSTIVSQWTYDTGAVYATEVIDPIEVTLENVIEGRKISDQWINLVYKFFNPAPLGTSNFEYEIQRAGNILTGKTDIAGETIHQASYDHSTGIVTLYPRPELTLTWADYELYRKFEKIAVETAINIRDH